MDLEESFSAYVLPLLSLGDPGKLVPSKSRGLRTRGRVAFCDSNVHFLLFLNNHSSDDILTETLSVVLVLVNGWKGSTQLSKRQVRVSSLLTWLGEFPGLSAIAEL